MTMDVPFFSNTRMGTATVEVQALNKPTNTRTRTVFGVWQWQFFWMVV
jgi:hypothetical protein